LLLILLFGIGTRGPTIFALACIMSFYLYEHRRPWLSPTVMLGIAASAGLFAAIGDDRGKAIRNMFTQDVSTVHSSKTAAPLERMDFANMEMLEFLVQTVPDRTGSYEYFVDQLQIFTEPIPRSLWKDKPVGQPIRFFSLYDYGYPIGITRSLPGEGWMQLGLVGVILWCGLWGWALGTIHDRYVKSRQSPFQTYAYFALLALMVVCYRVGLLLSVLRFGLFAFAPALLWYGIWRLQGNATHPPIATGASSTPAFAPGDSPAERRRRLADMAQRSSA